MFEYVDTVLLFSQGVIGDRLAPVNRDATELFSNRITRNSEEAYLSYASFH
jgi:hypothetical protein